MRKLILLAAITTALLGASATSATATTWSGTCHIEGTTHVLDSPLTFRLQHHDFEIAGYGWCEGTLNGRPYSGPAHQYMDGRMNAPFSCLTGIAKDVPGAFTFGDDPNAVDATKIELVASGVQFGSEAPFHVEGAYNGHALGRQHFLVDQSALEDCAGPGLTEVDYQLDATTITPLYG